MFVFGGFLIFLGVCSLAFAVNSVLYLLFGVGFIWLGIRCLRGVRKKTTGKRGSVEVEPYEGSTAGRFVDLGGGQCVDLEHPDDIVDGVNWCRDTYGNIYSTYSNETISYNNGYYSYDSGESDDADD